MRYNPLHSFTHILYIYIQLNLTLFIYDRKIALRVFDFYKVSNTSCKVDWQYIKSICILCKWIKNTYDRFFKRYTKKHQKDHLIRSMSINILIQLFDLHICWWVGLKSHLWYPIKTRNIKYASGILLVGKLGDGIIYKGALTTNFTRVN